MYEVIDAHTASIGTVVRPNFIEALILLARYGADVHL